MAHPDHEHDHTHAPHDHGRHDHGHHGHHDHTRHEHHDHGHRHDHGHHHGHHTHGMKADRALGIALLLNGAFLLVELGFGLWSGSLALLSDAVHMLSDVGSLVLALGAARMAARGPSAATTFGLARAEVLGAFLNGLMLVGAALWIAVEAMMRLRSGSPEIDGAPVLVVAVVGLAINLGSAAVLHRADHGNLNIQGALLHMLADALGSAAAIAAALALLFGVYWADPAVSLFVALLVGIGALRLLRDAGRVLLEMPPDGLDVGSVREALCGIDGVIEVHDLHAWSLDGRNTLVSAHLVVAEGVAHEGALRSARRVLVSRFGIGHSTVQIEAAPGGDPQSCCETRCEAR